MKSVFSGSQRQYVALMNSTTPNSQPDSDRNLQSGAPAFLWALVGVMSAMEMVFSLSDAGIFGSQNWRWAAVALGAFWQPLLSGEFAPLYPGQKFYMYITYAFLHGDLIHLTMNSVVLLSLGKLATARIGSGKTILVLFLSAIGGGLAFGILSSSNLPMIGASGAVFGLIGLWQAWDFGIRRQSALPLRPVVLAIIALIAANVVFFVILNGGLAWEAHLGGWLAGWFSGRSFARIDAQAKRIR